jgi:hypothetical protein
MKPTADQLIYVMEIAAKNADAHGLKPLEFFTLMYNRIEGILEDGETDDEGEEKSAEG